MVRIDIFPRAELIVGGAGKTVLELSATHGERSPSSTLNAQIKYDQGGFLGTEGVAARLGYRSLASLRPVFGGQIDPDSIRWAPKQVSFSAVGPLRAAMEATGIEDTALVNTDPELPPTDERYAVGFINATDGAIVTALLALVGLTDVAIEDTGTLFATLAPDTASRWAVRLPSDQAPYQLIEEIDTITGCVTFDGPDGRVARIATTGLPSGVAARTFAEYVDFTDGATRDRGSSARVVNKVTVTGQSGILADGTPYSIVASRTKVSPYVPTPPGTREYTFQSDLIETEEVAGACAARLLAKLGRRVETVTLPLVYGDASLRAGMTVAVDSPNVLEVTSTTLYRVVEVRHQFAPFRTTLTLEGAAGAEGTDPNQSPVPAIDYTVDLETLANGDAIAVVELDSSGSYDPDGSIVLRTWDGDPVVPTPIGDGVRAVAVYNPLDDSPAPTVTLTVQDDLGKIKAATREIVAEPGRTYARELWIAEGDKLAHTPDQLAYDEFAVNAVTIPEESGDEYTVAATSGGAASRVLADGTIAALADLANVTALSISRDPGGAETGVAWAGASDGAIYRSADYGQTWAAVAPLPNGGECRAIAESPYASGDVYAGGGNVLYHSYDNAASWQAFYTHADATLLLTRIASGIAPGLTDAPDDDQSLMWLGFSSGGAGGATDRVVERGGGLTKSLPGGADEPLDVTGLTMSLDAGRIIVADTLGRLWVAPSTGSGDLELLGDYSGDLGDIKHLIRDGRLPVAWLASSTGTWKLVGEVGPPLQVRDEPAEMIGYGRLIPVAASGFTVASAVGAALLELWDGAALADPPTNWATIGYDDSDWLAAVEADASGQTSPVPGATPIWKTNLPPLSLHEEAMLVRQAFTLPPGPIRTATLQASFDSNGDIYLNGHHLGGESGTGASGPILTFDIDPALLYPGATNVIGAWGRDIARTPPATAHRWITYKLETNGGA